MIIQKQRDDNIFKEVKLLCQTIILLTLLNVLVFIVVGF